MERETLSDHELLRKILQAMEEENSAEFCELYHVLGARKGPDWDVWRIREDPDPEDMWCCFVHLFDPYDYYTDWLRVLDMPRLLKARETAGWASTVFRDEICRRLGPEALPYLENGEEKKLLSMAEQMPHESGLMFHCLYVCPEEPLCIRFYQDPAGICGKFHNSSGCKAVMRRSDDPEAFRWELQRNSQWNGAGYTYPRFAWYDEEVLYWIEGKQVWIEQVLPLREYDDHISCCGSILPDGSLELDVDGGKPLRLVPYYLV